MPNLPAPYVSPWREFGRNLRALAADLRLRIQELWRRNGEGDLPQPGFWPRQLAAFFWPALLVLLLALAVVALMQRSASSAPSLDRVVGTLLTRASSHVLPGLQLLAARIT